MKFQILGPLVVGNGESDIELSRRSHRRLLEILVIEAGRPMRIETLIDRFWGEKAPATARAALHTHVSAIRKLLGRAMISTDDDAYQLAVADENIDVAIFRKRAADARRAASERQWSSVMEHAEGALDLWRGTPYQELTDDEFSRAEIAGLEELRLELLELRAGALLALDRAGDVLSDLERLVIEHPLREGMWQQLMMARFRLGRNADALRAYREIEGHLAEIGLEPGEPLRRLEERILFQDRTLRNTPHNLPIELDAFVWSPSQDLVDRERRDWRCASHARCSPNSRRVCGWWSSHRRAIPRSFLQRSQ
jgi:DNA-binding SARP family transcriptional activator